MDEPWEELKEWLKAWLAQEGPRQQYAAPKFVLDKMEELENKWR